MSLIENIAQKKKDSKIGTGHEGSAYEVEHTQKNTSTEISEQQMQVLDNILYGTRGGYSSSAYSSKREYQKNELDVDFIDKGKTVIRVMDKHNFYEAEIMPDEYLNDAPIGLLTKLWIHISRAVKE